MWLKQGQIEVDGEDGCDYGSVECGIATGNPHAKHTNPAGIPLPNQSKPIVPTSSYFLS